MPTPSHSEELTREEGAVYITDGYFSVGLLEQNSKQAENGKLGLHHLGFQIESIDDVEKRLRDFDPTMHIEELPNGGYAEYRVTDPEGLTIDLSEGRHNIQIRKSGFVGYLTDVQIRRGETTNLDVQLKTQPR